MTDRDSDIAALMEKGRALHAEGKIGQAELAYKEILKIRRNDPDALHLIGVVSCQRGDMIQGIRMIHRALHNQPEFPEAYGSLAAIYLNTGDTEEALEMARTADEQGGAGFAVLDAMSRAQISLGKQEESLEVFARMDAIRPDDPDVLSSWGGVLFNLGRFAEAEEKYARVTAIDPGNIEARCFQAQALKSQGRFQDALDMLEEILASNPGYVPAKIHAGDSMQALGRGDEAIEQFRNAIAVEPEHAEAHFNLGVALLTNEQYSEGWREYSWRFRTDAYARFRPPLPVPLWEGEPLDGKSILIFAEQGMGDTIQFARYAVPLKQRGAEVHCRCAAVVADLIATISGISGVHRMDGSPVPICDFQISMMDLPRIFNTDRETIPAKDGYVSAPKDTFRPNEGFGVGLVWQGNRAHKNDAFRSIPLSCLEDVIAIDGINFYSLQVGEEAQQIVDLGWVDQIEDLAPGIRDFSDSADILSKLDLLITIDSAPAHLAGALGTPVWTLLPTIADWRWGRHGQTTCWYNSMRLFRQVSLGEWGSVVDEIADALKRLRDAKSI